jgi:hypothetical protein
MFHSLIKTVECGSGYIGFLETAVADFGIKYLGKFKVVFETALVCESEQ